MNMHHSYPYGLNIDPNVEPLVNEIYVSLNNKIEPNVITKKVLKMIDEHTQTQAISQFAFGVYLSHIQNNAKELINVDSKELKFKHIGLILFDCLLDVNYNDDIFAERRLGISQVLQTLLKTMSNKFPVDTSETVLRAAALCVGHLARVASPSELETMTNIFISLAQDAIKDLKSESNRLVGALLMNQFALNAPHFIFARRHVVLTELWNSICDKNLIIRVASAETLESTLFLIAQRDALPEHLRQALKQVEAGFSSSRVEKIVGSLLILDIIAGGTAVTASELIEATKNYHTKDGGMHIDDLIWKVLMWKDYAEMDLKQHVIKLIPKLAVAFNSSFLHQNEYTPPHTFLQYSIKYLLDTIKLKKDRSIAYISLGKLFITMASYLRSQSAVEEIFASINDGFKDPFCTPALECLGMVVSISPPFRLLVNSLLIDSIFHGGLTKDLIKTLEIIFNHVQSVRRHVQVRLCNDVTYVLQSNSVILDEDNAAFRSVNSPQDFAAGKPNSRNGGSNWGSPSKGIIRAIKGSKPQFFSSISPFVNKNQAKPVSSDDILVLALDVLASPLFFPRQLDQSVHLLRISHEYVLRYLDDYNPRIRNAAAITCISIVDKASSSTDMEAELHTLVPKLIDSLLMVGVGDDSEDIRHKIFSSLTPSLDHYIAKSECIHCLIDALNDESVKVRTAAISVLARASHYDSVHIMPIILLSLRLLLNLLQTSRDSTTLQGGVRMLQSLVKGLGSHVVPYVKQLLKPLLELLSNSSYEIVGEVLSTIGEVAIACPDLIHEHLDQLFPSLIQALRDSSSISKQETAVVALGKLVTSLHMVNEPYTQYPGLFEGLVSAIQNSQEEAAELRQQAIKTAGLLGALEVGLFEKYMRAKTGVAGNVFAQDMVEDDLNDDSELSKKAVIVDDDSLNKLEKYYLSVVIKSLMNVLRDNSQSISHQMAINISTRIIRNLGRRSHYQTDEIIEAIFFRLHHPVPGGANMQGALIDFLIVVITSVGSHIYKYYTRIIEFICDNFSSHQEQCLMIIEALYISISLQDFNYLVRDIVPLFIQTLKTEPITIVEEMVFTDSARNSGKVSSEDNESKKTLPRTGLVISTLIKIADGVQEYKIVLIPVLLGIVSEPSVVSSRRFEALCAMMYLVKNMELHQLVGRIIHPIVRLLSSTESSLVEASLSSLSILACRLGRSYEPFIVPVRRKTKTLARREGAGRIKQLDEYEGIVGLIIKDRPLPRFPESASYLFPEVDEKRATQSTSKYVNESLPISVPMLETAWTLIGRTGASDFVEWYRRLTFEFIRQSPSSTIRQCTGLAKNYRPFAQELLNASFISLWDSICSSDSAATDVVMNIPLINALESALKNSNIPNNITNAILNLAEFMDLQDKMLPFDIRVLAKNAESRSGMLAKCVRYREMEFRSVNVPPTSECVESLITVYHQLGFQDAAVGLIEFVKQKYPNIPMQANWLEKLNRYDDARALYEKENMDWEALFNGEAPPLNELWLSRELGILRCLNHLGNFEELETKSLNLKEYIKNAEQTEEKAWLSQIKVEEKSAWMSQIQHLGANAAWMLGHWTRMEEFIDAEYVSTDNHVLENNTNFYRTIIAIQHREFSRALNMIKETRSTLSENIGFSLNQNYSRAKRGMVSMQVLAEIEEVVEYSQVAAKADIDGNDQKFDMSSVPIHSGDIASRKAVLLSKWRGRFKWVPKEVKVYRQILGVHTLVAEPLDDLESWLELVTLCRKEKKYNLCENILRRLGAPLAPNTHDANVEGVLGEGEEHINPRMLRVFFSCYKYQWDIGEKQFALHGLIKLTKVKTEDEHEDQKLRVFKSFCLLKCAEWMRDTPGFTLSEVLDTVREARELTPENYAVHHAWALFNFIQLKDVDTDDKHKEGRLEHSMDDMKLGPRRSINSLRKVHSYSGASLANLAASTNDVSHSYVVEAIRGFTRSLCLSHDQPIVNVLQDTLRLLTLWFSYGHKTQIFEVLNAEIDKISADNWLLVLPQLIARMHVVTAEITGPLKRLLVKIASNHPQAIVCPILVAFNTADLHQKAVATEVIRDLRLKRNKLVDEATMVSNELMRVAITPHELWNDGLEKAAKYYVADKSLDNMMSLLFDLHESLNYNDKSSETPKGSSGFIDGMSKVGYTTLRDISFRHSYSRDLTEAHDWLIKFRKTGRTTDLHQAWDLYHKVFKRISSQLKTFKNVNLNHVSPALCSARNLQLAVPGTYVAPNDVITINGFSQSIDVIASKQRPRKITMVGSNGVNYHFLLKGNEDLRQDERVMQLFGLINACLENDRSTRSRALAIVRYSVLPLSNNSGVIGWVENCDTLNQLIRQYRLSKDLKVNIEARLKISKAPDYDKLTLIQKIDIFKQVQDETTGLDLAKMLWLKSKSSDVWVERRSNYTTSLAVMSMVGYILGLGDRHPSNLMLDRVSGRIVHIDFGDCFEVSMHRSVFPETVPFRLTRMMISAMEASGIEGTYRFTCERVMRVLRANNASVMAMLEAFVYDPLISWRLLVRPKFEFDHVDRGDGEVNESSTAIDNPEEIIWVNSTGSVEGAQLLSDNEHGHDAVSAKSLAIASSVANLGRRHSAKAIAAFSDPERRSIEGHHHHAEDNLNARAMEVIGRIQAKLTGTDFSSNSLEIEDQVDKLIKEATSVENLCQLFAGWCSLW